MHYPTWAHVASMPHVIPGGFAYLERLPQAIFDLLNWYLHFRLFRGYVCGIGHCTMPCVTCARDFHDTTKPGLIRRAIQYIHYILSSPIPVNLPFHSSRSFQNPRSEPQRIEKFYLSSPQNEQRAVIDEIAAAIDCPARRISLIGSRYFHASDVCMLQKLVVV